MKDAASVNLQDSVSFYRIDPSCIREAKTIWLDGRTGTRDREGYAPEYVLRKKRRVRGGLDYIDAEFRAGCSVGAEKKFGRTAARWPGGVGMFDDSPPCP